MSYSHNGVDKNTGFKQLSETNTRRNVGKKICRPKVGTIRYNRTKFEVDFIELSFGDDMRYLRKWVHINIIRSSVINE